MRLIDEKGRLFGLVNPIDLLVVALLLVAAAVVANMLFGIFDSEPAELLDVSFDVTALGVRDWQPGQVAEGDELFSDVAGRLGEIVAVDAYPSRVEVVGQDGEAAVVDSALLTDVRMTVVGRGTADGLGYRVGGLRIQSNSRIDVVTRGLEAERAYVSNIGPLESR